MSNTIKCQDCVFYDGQQKFTQAGQKPAWYGWCAKKSIYPFKAPDGQVIPPDAMRADEEDPIAKPFIVQGSKVRVDCTDVIKK